MSSKRSRSPVKMVYFTWGRLNPVTTGHEKMIRAMINQARRNHAIPVIGMSRSQDPFKNPLTPNEKLNLVQRVFSKNVRNIYALQTIPLLIETLQTKYGPNAHLKIVVGENRKNNFSFIKNRLVISRPNGNTSATQVREAALRGNIPFVHNHIPESIRPNTEKLIAIIKNRMSQQPPAKKSTASRKTFSSKKS